MNRTIAIALLAFVGSTSAAVAADTARNGTEQKMSRPTSSNAAASTDGWTLVNKELQRSPHSVVKADGRWVHNDKLPHGSIKLATTRGSAQGEMQASDGWVFSNGEWSSPDHALERQGGKWVHTDNLSHDTRPVTPVFTAEQLKLQKELYQN